MMEKKNIIVKHACNDSLGTLLDVLDEVGLNNNQVIDIENMSLPDIRDTNMVFLMGCFDAAYNDKIQWLAQEMQWIQNLNQANIPMMGICFGAQLLSRVLGGQVYKNHTLEHAWADVQLLDESWQHKGPWFTFHFDAFIPPKEATLLAKTDIANQAFIINKNLGMQFHPEINPHMFDSWIDYWKSTQDGLDFLHKNQDTIDFLQSEVVRREADNRSNFIRVLNDFLNRI